jgi:hypothetical protein
LGESQEMIPPSELAWTTKTREPHRQKGFVFFCFWKLHISHCFFFLVSGTLRRKKKDAPAKRGSRIARASNIDDDGFYSELHAPVTKNDFQNSDNLIYFLADAPDKDVTYMSSPRGRHGSGVDVAGYDFVPELTHDWDD